MGFFATLLTTPARLTGLGRNNTIQVSKMLVDSAQAEVTGALETLQTSAKGLTQDEVEARLEKYGTNEVAREKRQTWSMRLWDNVKNPLVILLVVLGVISYLTGDLRATILIFLMVLLGIVLRYFQESRADEAAAKLKAMVSTTATVVRDGQQQEIPLQELVPGDVIHLAAGDMVPADVRVLTAKDLFLNQSALTGESLPVEKRSAAVDRAGAEPAGDAKPVFPGLQRGKRHRQRSWWYRPAARLTSARWPPASPGSAN